MPKTLSGPAAIIAEEQKDNPAMYLPVRRRKEMERPFGQTTPSRENRPWSNRENGA